MFCMTTIFSNPYVAEFLLKHKFRTPTVTWCAVRESCSGRPQLVTLHR